MKIKLLFSLLLFVSFSIVSTQAQEDIQLQQNKKIVILGSSVAAGWVTSYQEKYDMQNGYAYRLARYLEPKGWEVANISIPGFDTKSTIERFEGDVLPLEPDYVIIGLSMSNEGLETQNPDTVFESYREGMKKLIQLCQSNGIQAVVGLCYSNDNYTEEQYEYLKRMNRLISTWDIPSVNFLGVLDDGHGHFPEGYTFDPNHPDDRGHEEMFYAFVPEMFDALEAGETISGLAEGMADENMLSLGKSNAVHEAIYIPGEVMHSFTLAFQFSSREKGKIAEIKTTKGTQIIQINREGSLEYLSSEGNIVSDVHVNDRSVRWAFISHQYLLGLTSLYINDQFVASLDEQMEPLMFSIGNNPVQAAYNNFILYRGALNGEEVSMITRGQMYHASLELASPLPGDGELISSGQELINLAPSPGHAIIDPVNKMAELEVFENKIEIAANMRKNELKVEHRQAIEIDPTELDQYVGAYEVAPDDNMLVMKEDDKLFLDDHGRKAEILPEGDDRFFIHYPGDILVTFQKDESGKVSGLIFSMNGREMAAKKR